MRQCNINGCARPVIKRGFCSAHYQRWRRHGSPTGGSTGIGDAAAFLEKAISYQGTDCLLWPYARGSHGYGVVRRGARTVHVPVLICTATHGNKPSPRHDAAHNCGVAACCTPAHLRWDTHQGNMADMIGHGTSGRGRGVKLTTEQVLAIRAQAHRPQRALAEEFGVSREHIRDIRNHKRWIWLP